MATMFDLFKCSLIIPRWKAIPHNVRGFETTALQIVAIIKHSFVCKRQGNFLSAFVDGLSLQSKDISL